MILRNCKLINELVEGYKEEFADIYIYNNMIKDIKPLGYNFEVNEKEIDINKNIVIPGLFDIHVHLTLSGDDTLIDNNKDSIELAFDSIKHAQDSLYAGFTTIRDVGSNDNIGIRLRDSINKGYLVGPNIITSGRIITPTENGNDFFSGLYVEADGKYDILKAVREEVKQGANFIKIMATGAVMNPGGEPGQQIYTLDEMIEVVKGAKFKNTYVAAHCHGTKAIKSAIKAGVKTIEHASMLDDECIELLKNNESYIVPTLTILMGMVESMPSSSTFMIQKANDIIESVRVGVTKAYKEGLIIGFASDTGGSPAKHGNNADEFIHRKNIFNMSEIDLLKQATIDSAKILGVDDSLGSIKIGKIADLVILDENPLDDIYAMKNNIKMVIKSGNIVK